MYQISLGFFSLKYYGPECHPRVDQCEIWQKIFYEVCVCRLHFRMITAYRRLLNVVINYGSYALSWANWLDGMNCYKMAIFSKQAIDVLLTSVYNTQENMIMTSLWSHWGGGQRSYMYAFYGYKIAFTILKYSTG